MAIISPFTKIRAISLFHLTAAYFFLTAPVKLADQNVVYILGESMRLVQSLDEKQNSDKWTDRTQPHATSLDKPSDASAFIALILAFLGLSDLTAASLSEETSIQYWTGRQGKRGRDFAKQPRVYVGIPGDRCMVLGKQATVHTTSPGHELILDALDLHKHANVQFAHSSPGLQIDGQAFTRLPGLLW
nr:hypothetical protein CFP56_04049 [Quercus suber]